MARPRTLFDKIWDDHVIAPQGEGTYLIYIDLHLCHEVTTPQAFEGLKRSRPQGAPSRRDDRGCGPQHPDQQPQSRHRRARIRNCRSIRWSATSSISACPTSRSTASIRVSSTSSDPSMGLSQPGMTIVCGDSHTATHGALGALAFGIGTSEVEHVLATQTLIQAHAKNMLVEVNGTLGAGVSPKDVILAIIGKIGTAGGTGHVIEYAGSTFRSMSMEGRMTVCNMAIESGARAGLVAPDEITFAYVKGRQYAPKGAAWEQALAYWKTLPSDPGAHVRPQGGARRRRYRAARHLGHQPGADRADHRPRSRPRGYRRPAAARRHRAGAAVHATEAEDAARRGPGAARLHWLVHQQPHRGSARRRRRGSGPQGRRGGARDGGAGLRPGEASGRRGRARSRSSSKPASNGASRAARTACR